MPGAGGVAYAWLKHPTDTALNMRVVLKLGSFVAMTRRATRGVYPIIGRRYPVVVTDTRQAREGTFAVMVCDDSTDPTADAEAILALLNADSVLKLEPDASTGIGEFWFSAGDVSEVRPVGILDHEAREFTVPFIETDAPVINTVITTATWQDVIDGWASWTTTQADWTDWATLIGYLP